jgi:hypothetical protein
MDVARVNEREVRDGCGFVRGDKCERKNKQQRDRKTTAHDLQRLRGEKTHNTSLKFGRESVKRR